MDHSTDTTTAKAASWTALEASSECDLRVPFYCEENVWRLAYRRRHAQQRRCCQPPPPSSSSSSTDCNNNDYAVFVSNERQCVTMYHQRVTESFDIVWDYHVILISQETTPPIVLDMDSRLPYPCPLSDYLEQSFDKEGRHAPLFRVVPASDYLKHFSSDRSHMYNPSSNTWKAPPPLYECIQCADATTPSNVKEYIDMSMSTSNTTTARTRHELLEQITTNHNPMGVVMTMVELKNLFQIQ